MKKIITIVIKEFLQLKRDPRLFGLVFMAPVIQLVLLGYAATLDVNNVKTVVYDQDKTVTSRNFIEKFQRSGYFSIDYSVNSYADISELINKGKVLWALVIPDEFEENISTGKQAKVQAIFDGSDGNKTQIAFGYVNGVVSSYSKNILIEQSNRTGMRSISLAGSVTPELRVWYNPDLKTRNFMVPGIMGLLLTVITTTLMAMAVVKEREIGTLEQIIVTPIKPIQLIIGKTIPFIILGFLDVFLVMAVMVFWFGIGIRGDFVFLMIASLIYVLSSLGIGLFVSTVSRTQQQAMMVSMFGILMPMNFLSGFVFPIENMPAWIQPVTYAIPLRYYITILRSVILKGDGFIQLIPETLALLGIGVSILFLSSLRFRKKLD